MVRRTIVQLEDRAEQGTKYRLILGGKYAIVAKWRDSKWWNPNDWYLVKVMKTYKDYIKEKYK